MEGIDTSSELNQVICRFLLLRLLLWKIGTKSVSVTQECPDAAASSTEQINVGNWESLPGDVQDTIVAALPFQQVLQFRSVSKAFQDILRRPTFLQPRLHRHATEGKFSPMIFFLDSATSAWQWLGFDLISNQWNRLPSLSFLATPDANLFKEFLFAGSGGLICVNVSKNPNVEQLIVCNPLTRAVRKLPPLNFSRQPVLMNMLLDKDTNNYKIIVAGSATTGSEELSRKTEVYDSATQEWKVVGDVPGPEYALNEFQTGAVSEGVLYCVGFISTGDGITHGLLAYHVETEKWLDHNNWECTLPRLPCCQHIASNTTQIFESGGSIFIFWEQEHSRTIVHFCVARLETRPLSNSSNHIPSWTVVVSKNKTGSRGLSVYPEHLCVGQGADKVCIFNTLDLTGFTYKIGEGLITGSNIAIPLPEPPPLLERAPAPNNIEMQQGGGSDTSSSRTNSTESSLFFSLNSLNFVFEPSFHTPV